MAATISLNLFQLRRIWLILNLFTLATLGSAAYTLWQITSTEVSALADIQLATLIKSRMDDLHNGRYRNFVEGAGEKFRDLSVRITSGSETFQTGTFVQPLRCSTRSLSGGGFIAPISVELCRPFEFPTKSLLTILGGFICFASLSYLILRKSEKDAINALIDFVTRQGLSVNRSGGLLSILRRIREMVQEIEDSRTKQSELAKSSALAQLAKQVAHDIKSPLAALETVSNRMKSNNDVDIDVLKSSVRRLAEITSDLQDKEIAVAPGATSVKLPPHNSPLSRHTLQTIVDDLVSEKRAEFAHKLQLLIHVSPVSSLNSAAIVEVGALKRALSNIFNNAVEAMVGNGSIEITTSADEWDSIIAICDNGPGIDDETLAKLKQPHPYTTKVEGQGLGLFHAQQILAKVGGSLAIASIQQGGTSVQLRLPRLRV